MGSHCDDLFVCNRVQHSPALQGRCNIVLATIGNVLIQRPDTVPLPLRWLPVRFQTHSRWRPFQKPFSLTDPLLPVRVFTPPWPRATAWWTAAYGRKPRTRCCRWPARFGASPGLRTAVRTRNTTLSSVGPSPGGLERRESILPQGLFAQYSKRSFWHSGASRRAPVVTALPATTGPVPLLNCSVINS